MFRRAAATVALTAAGLVAATPLAEAGVPTPTPSGTAADAPAEGGNGNVQLLNGLDVLPVQACGLQVPVLSGILQAPDGHCGVANDGAHVNKP